MKSITIINLLLSVLGAAMAGVNLGDPPVMKGKPILDTAIVVDDGRRLRLQEQFEVEVTYGTWYDDEEHTWFVPDTAVIDFTPDSTQAQTNRRNP